MVMSIWGKYIFRLNPENFFHLTLPFSRGNHFNDSKMEFPDFFEITLYIIFAIFPKMTMTVFVKNFQNHIKDEIFKIQELTLFIIFAL